MVIFIFQYIVWVFCFPFSTTVMHYSSIKNIFDKAFSKQLSHLLDLADFRTHPGWHRLDGNTNQPLPGTYQGLHSWHHLVWEVRFPHCGTESDIMPGRENDFGLRTSCVCCTTGRAWRGWGVADHHAFSVDIQGQWPKTCMPFLTQQTWPSAKVLSTFWNSSKISPDQLVL